MKLVFHPGDTADCIYDDALQTLVNKLGRSDVRRASHVEPFEELTPEDKQTLLAEGYSQDAGRWFADLRPSGGTLDGPFQSRNQAIEHELAWINKNILK